MSRLQRLTGLWSTYVQDRSALMRMHLLAVRMTIAHVWIHHTGYGMIQRELAVEDDVQTVDLTHADQHEEIEA